MKKIGLLAVTVLLLAGCAAMKVSTMAANNRMNLVQLAPGMSRASVMNMMGTRIAVYECDQVDSKIKHGVTINNPYRTELIEPQGRKLEVLYYVTNIDNANCAIEESSLTPFVFENSLLIGWGNNFLAEVMSKPVQPAAAQAGQK